MGVQELIPDSLLRVSLTVALLLAVVPATAEAQPTGRFELTILKEPVTLTTLHEWMDSTDRRQQVMFWHSRSEVRWGGFVGRDISVSEAVSMYQDDFQALFGDVPRVFALAVEAGVDVPEELVAQSMDLPTRGFLPIVRRPWAVTKAPLHALRVMNGGSSDPAIGLTGPGADAVAPWAPKWGRLLGEIVTPATNNRRIFNEIVFSDAGLEDLDGFAYEHDVKLVNPEAECNLPDIFGCIDSLLDSSLRPVCNPFSENDFWANRDSFTFDWNYPDAADPYIDTEWVDSCRMMDFTIGLASPSPTNLVADQIYQTSILASGSEDVAASVVKLSFERKSVKTCDSLVDDLLPGSTPWCVGSPSGQPGEETQRMILESDGETLPGCFDWWNGFNPRSVAHFPSPPPGPFWVSSCRDGIS